MQQQQQNASGPLLRYLRPKVFDAASAEELEAAVETWLEARGEERLAAVTPLDTGSHSVLILYTD